MHKRFTVYPWVTDHQFEYTHWRLVPTSKLEKIKEGLSRFRHPHPLVSIVIPVWNEEKNILRTLSSLSALELPWPTELIVVDNNSTDATAMILDTLGVPVVHERRQGIAFARLAGLRASRGVYQLCGDGDSLYPPTWIKAMIEPLINNISLTCVYGNYSFLPYASLTRNTLGLYEIVAETLFEMRRWRREFLNVRGANFAFRVAQGLEVKGFEMPITRVYGNEENSCQYVVYGEDGRMGRKLSEIGELKLIRTDKARIWTSARRLAKDGSLAKAFIKRLKKESARVLEYAFGSKRLKHTTDHLVTTSQQL